jgi:D-alanyl-D-alanine carboxypeptidase (penicillin-binding protein 5/6)
VALQAKPLTVGDAGPTITFTAADAALRAKYIALDGETAPMAAGATMTESDLIRVALIASANNYAATLAAWAYGSQASFVTAAKAWLAANHLDHTTMVEPTGISYSNTSTATDLVALGKLAMANPVVAGIVSTQSITLPAIGTVKNTNSLLGIDGVDGIKTGTLSMSNLLFAADHRVGSKHVTIIGAVMGADDHDALYASVRTLLKDTENGFHSVTLAAKGQAFAAYSTPWGDDARAVAERTESVLVWSNTPITTVVSPTSAPIANGAAGVGRVTFTVNGTSIRVPLVLDHALDPPSAIWRLGHPGGLAAPTS